MLEETSRTHEFSESSKDTSPVRWNLAWFRPLTAILLIAAMLRLFQLGQSSLWYDEVVTMRLARTEDPAHLLRLLQQIDATRAPLHPLLLQCWIFLFGASDLAGRSLSALCGILTVAMVHWVSRQAFDVKTGLWAAWLSACSPLLVYYSREVRMYAWLVLVTCLGWGLLFSHRRLPKLWKSALYGLSLVAIAYSHPLGILMVGTLGLTSFLQPKRFKSRGGDGSSSIWPSWRQSCRGWANTWTTPRNRPAARFRSGFCSGRRSRLLAETSRSCSFARC